MRITALRRALGQPEDGPTALMLAEDAAEIEGTLRHLLGLGFGRVVAVLPDDLEAPAIGDPRLHLVTAETRGPGRAEALLDAALAAAPPGLWLHWCHNAEYLLFPHCESRGVEELCRFVEGERRAVVGGCIVDLYPADVAAHPDGVAPGAACFDRIGYVAMPRHDEAGQQLPRQVRILGGLRRRFAEHADPARHDLARPMLLRVAPGMRRDPDGRFAPPEYDTIEGPWHRSPTAALASFRAAKALRRNPASRAAATRLRWAGSARFDGTSRQLLEAGLMEPGQWV
ncbi:hypothetical protein [Limimaricola pyoseonensis]|uniref:Glycosyl transferase family 2 n=1 Tax=Limimaricola pyoseonensis TaxID=521013 RepID=A0A1G7ICZ6_9RHOB|nr:hypothetical protein [Limimaricola pyoseonensis]SDF10458.1 hypothetical protein SAMN04488567_3412 [Limimaricola pyoseonensis]